MRWSPTRCFAVLLFCCVVGAQSLHPADSLTREVLDLFSRARQRVVSTEAAHNRSKSHNAEPPFRPTNQTVVDALYQLIQEVDYAFTLKKCQYWLEAGSALGARRDGGLIFYDDDADLGVDTRDAECVEQALQMIRESAKVCYHPWSYGYKVYWCFPVRPHVKLEIGTEPYTYPFLDIFLVDVNTTNADGRTFYKNASTWDHCYWLRDELLPIVDCSFGPLSLKCGSKPDNYLDRCYGSYGGWRSFLLGGKDHHTGEIISRQRRSIAKVFHKVAWPSYVPRKDNT